MTTEGIVAVMEPFFPLADFADASLGGASSLKFAVRPHPTLLPPSNLQKLAESHVETALMVL